MNSYCKGFFEQVGIEVDNIKIIPSLLVLLIVVPVIELMMTKYWFYSILIAPMLVAAIIMFRYKALGIYLLIIQIPFGAYRKIAIGGSSINLAWMIAGISILAVAIEIIANEKSLSILKAKLWWLLIPMLFVNTLSTIFSPYPETAQTELFEWIAAYIFIALILIRITPKGLFNTVPFWIVISMSLGSLCAVLGVYFNIGAEYFTQEGRGVGGAPDPNNFCLMIVFTIPLVLYFFIHAESPRKRMMYLGLLLLNLMGVVSTNSRSGVIVAAVVILITMMANHRKITAKIVKLIIPIGLAVVLVVPLVLPETLIDRMLTLTETYGDTSLNRRASYVNVAFDAYFKSPVIGTGPFTFQNIYEKSREARRWQRGQGAAKTALQRQAHNTYLEILVGSGTIGTIFFLGIIGVSYLNFSKARRMLTENNLYRQADLMTSYQLSFISLLLFFTFFSDITHKYFLLAIPLAELAVRFSGQIIKNSNAG